MAHTELDLRERRIIKDMLNTKISISKIAAELGRHRSTIYRRHFYLVATVIIIRRHFNQPIELLQRPHHMMLKLMRRTSCGPL